ncbi:hypothetical protein NEHOM01_1090 [Nematocida homosporus]|uniref:uncharacterized protein n=1 Tax=Nematocida homosporus TaxID=1912981 RepID=UPI00221F5F15|nr:uncharacterized protein NEHOM01_1090 [Nematocida homosporus]KAI5185813.1 hypothetical protein NEHOM01_1090 [Nematocida homosporus]
MDLSNLPSVCEVYGLDDSANVGYLFALFMCRDVNSLWIEKGPTNTIKRSTQLGHDLRTMFIQRIESLQALVSCFRLKLTSKLTREHQIKIIVINRFSDYYEDAKESKESLASIDALLADFKRAYIKYRIHTIIINTAKKTLFPYEHVRPFFTSAQWRNMIPAQFLIEPQGFSATHLRVIVQKPTATPPHEFTIPNLAHNPPPKANKV